MSAVNQVHSAMNAANLVGQASLMNAASSMGVLGSGPQFPSIEKTRRASMPKTVFSGKIEVLSAANGYIVNIGRTEGYDYETFIAATTEEVNQIIQSQLVAFRLEDK